MKIKLHQEYQLLMHLHLNYWYDYHLIELKHIKTTKYHK